MAAGHFGHLGGHTRPPSMWADQRQFDKAFLPWRVVDALHSLSEIRRFCPENRGHEGLGVAVVQRKPARLYLDHDPVAWQKNMIRRWQSEAVEQRLVGHDGLRCLQAFAIATAKNVG